MRAICFNDLEKVRLVYADFAPTIPGTSKDCVWQETIQTSTAGTVAKCRSTTDVQSSFWRVHRGFSHCAKKKMMHTAIVSRFYFRAFQTREALARQGAASSSYSDLDETDNRNDLERDDNSFRRVFLNEAERALGSDMVPHDKSKGHEMSASEPHSLFDQGRKRPCNFYEDGFRVYVKNQSSHS